MSESALQPSEQAADEHQEALPNIDENGSTEPSATALEEQADHENIDTETMVELQHSKSLPEAIALLSKTTQDLEGRVNVLLAQHEEDFFAAFRSHMAKVQQHVEHLQACADEQKNQLERDLRIKTLQQEQ
ncbi:LOW QUALITY PROTEIN: myosin heavy chain, putative [Eimeria mitis]|uniref:Myosin heavy chain, putative n=1 Tax=Eimeria mitis TaxID=44415 RepID=U6K7A3_9EIME|nr:LOW QUALITY PROTEIN: myosin heavy chain, putative [Eimeria mitis]CDJ31348.1 myosin heavy chain, putative [Eimeria mitis]